MTISHALKHFIIIQKYFNTYNTYFENGVLGVHQLGNQEFCVVHLSNEQKSITGIVSLNTV